MIDGRDFVGESAVTPDRSIGRRVVGKGEATRGSEPSIRGGQVSGDPEESSIGKSGLARARKPCRLESRYAISRCNLSRPNDGGHVSRDLPFREIGNREIGSPGNRNSGKSQVKTPTQSEPSERWRPRVARSPISGNRESRDRKSW
jgi:hypothetical protein